MSLILNVFINLFRLLRNARARLFRSLPEFIWLPVTGALPEFEPPRRGFLRRRLDPRPPDPSLEAIRARLDRILADGRIRGIVLRVEDLDAGWASLEELRCEIKKFREAGKKVAAYLINPDTRSYYLASVADEVFAPPLSTLDVVGLRTRANFFKDSLSALGLEAEVLAVSPYKSAADSLARSDFSREAREQIERLLDRRFEELVAAISTGRGISTGEARVIIDHAPYPAVEATAKGLLDAALYEDELAGRLGDGGSPARLVEWRDAEKGLRVAYRKVKRREKAVGLVEVTGTIARGKSRKSPVPLPLLGRERAGSDSVVAALRVAEKSRRLGAVLLYVDSPGGDALASDLIWREVERVRGKKPVVVLMGNAAASGGYYVSAAASRIVARKGTVTGSVGVILTRPVAAGLLERAKINPVAIERGSHSNLLDLRLKPTPEELSVLNAQLQNFYGGFKDRVRKGRKIGAEELEEIAGGRVWTGSEARKLGLIDELGGFRDALRGARELAGISEDGSGALMKVTPPRDARPAPRDAVGEPVESLRIALLELLGSTRVWALSPYELSED